MQDQSQLLQRSILPATFAPKKLIWGIFGAALLLFVALWHQHTKLPQPLKMENADVKGTFIAELAEFHVKQLAGYGPKVFGNYNNEVLAAEYLKIQLSSRVNVVNPPMIIEYNEQNASGCYPLHLKSHGFVNCYDNIRNIIVKLTSKGSSGFGILVNCHYDSVPTSPGASDDGLNCAVMIEVLRVLSQASVPLRHDVIFLFNGAEETPLQGSHAFITQHPWATGIRAFINLEACGAGGREVLFQAGPNAPWLLNIYKKAVPHPHGLVVAEEVFQSGLVPSDTDFRIFRDFGLIPGLDFAHASNGYVYHTKYDNINHIQLGAIQHTGDNILQLVKVLASSDELDGNQNREHKGQVVYYDIFGLTMIVYHESTAYLINHFAIIISSISQFMVLRVLRGVFSYRRILKFFFTACKSTLYGWLLAAIYTFMTANVLAIFGGVMSWYSYPSIIFPLYICPMIACSLLMHLWKESRIMNTLLPLEIAQLNSTAIQFIFTVLLLVGTHLGIRSSAVLVLIVLFPALGNILLIACKRLRSLYMWTAVYLLGVGVGATYAMYLAILTFTLFVPIMGRAGALQNPEYLIGILSGIFYLLTSALLSSMIFLLRKPMYFVQRFMYIHVVVYIIILCTRVCFPYSSNPDSPTPQRVLIHHTRQIFHNSNGVAYHDNSLYWINHLDYNNIYLTKEEVPELSKAMSVLDYCDEAIFCGLPISLPYLFSQSSRSVWLPANQEPFPHTVPSLKVMNRVWHSDQVFEISFTANGPGWLNVVISPNTHVKMTNWSFPSPIPDGVPNWNNRPTYYVHYTSPHIISELKFALIFEVEVPNPEGFFDIAIIGHYLNDESISQSFRAFLDKYPNWTHVTPFVSSYSSWKY